MFGLESLIDILKARGAALGEIHHWANGDYMKTPQGWKEVKKDVRKHLDKLTKRMAPADEKAREHRFAMEDLKSRIDGIKSKLSEHPDSDYYKNELKEAEKRLIFHSVKAEQVGGRARRRAEDYLDQVRQYLKDHHETQINAKYADALKKLDERMAALEEGGDRYNQIMENHRKLVGSEYEDEDDAESAAEDEIEIEKEIIEDKQTDLHDLIWEKVGNRHDQIDERLDKLLEDSEEDTREAFETRLDDFEDIKTRYPTSIDRDPVTPISKVRERIRKNLGFRKRLADRLNLKSNLGRMLAVFKAGNRQGLVKKVITNQAGHRQTVWIRPDESPGPRPVKKDSGPSSKKPGAGSVKRTMAPQRGGMPSKKPMAAKPAEDHAVVQQRHEDFEKRAQEQRKRKGPNASIDAAEAGDIVQITNPKSRVRNQIGKVVQKLEDGLKVMMANGIFQDFTFDELAFAKSRPLGFRPDGVQILKSRIETFNEA